MAGHFVKNIVWLSLGFLLSSFSDFPIIMNKKYPAKVLLFGEYTVLFGGSALAIPYPTYSAQWRYDTVLSTATQELLDHLRTIASDLHANVNLTLLEEAVMSGLYFNSNIPQGMGLGSSAALSAAVYDLVSVEVPESMEDIRSDLAMIEGLYHGKSSGLDALVSFLSAPIELWDGRVKICKSFVSPMYIYLVSSGEGRSADGLITWYKDQLLKDQFRDKMKALAEASTKAIQHFIEGDLELPDISGISDMQWKYLRPLISDRIVPAWEEASLSDGVSMKICGAGGGGYYLLFAEYPLRSNVFGDQKIVSLVDKGTSIGAR